MMDDRPITWTNLTGFLTWTPQTDAADKRYFLAQIDCVEMDIIVQRDRSGQTWEAVAMAQDREVSSDEYPSALSAQIAAMGLVIDLLLSLAGDASRPAAGPVAPAARACLEELHACTRAQDGDFSTRAKQRLWPYTTTKMGDEEKAIEKMDCGRQQ